MTNFTTEIMETLINKGDLDDGFESISWTHFSRDGYAPPVLVCVKLFEVE